MHKSPSYRRFVLPFLAWLIALQVWCAAGVPEPNLLDASSQLCTAISEADTPNLTAKFIKIDAHVFFELVIKDVAAFENLVGTDCWKEGDGLGWHLHDAARFPGGVGEGPALCSSVSTGGHWDPTLACGPASGNPVCQQAAVPPSSALPFAERGGSPGYVCNPKVYYGGYTYACEVGDLSGKYGELVVPPIQNNTLHFAFYAEDNQDSLPTCELGTKSLVVHCRQGVKKRALCLKVNVEKHPLSRFHSAVHQAQTQLYNYGIYIHDTFQNDNRSTAALTPSTTPAPQTTHTPAAPHGTTIGSYVFAGYDTQPF